MIPEIVQVNSFELVVRTVRTNNHNEFNPYTAKIMPLWMNAYADGFCAANLVSYGVYHDYESDYNGDYSVSVSSESSANKGDKLVIAGGKYLKFVFTGAMPQAVINGWQVIWQYFKESEQYKRSYTQDFEKYIPNFPGVEIYISIL